MISHGLPRAVGIVSRVLAAILGGYALAALCSIALALVLPMERADAVLTGMMVALAVQAGAVVHVFAASTALRAWAGLVMAAVALAAVALLGHWNNTGRFLP